MHKLPDKDNNCEINKLKKDVERDVIWHSEELFGHAKMVLIRHQESLYRLMITRQGKLILTK